MVGGVQYWRAEEKLIEEFSLPNEERLKIIKDTLDNFEKLWRACWASEKKQKSPHYYHDYHDNILVDFINLRMFFLATLDELSELKPSLDLMHKLPDFTFYALLLNRFSLKTLHEWDPNWLRKIIGQTGKLPHAVELKRKEDLGIVLNHYCPQCIGEINLSDALFSQLLALDPFSNNRFLIKKGPHQGENFIDHYLATQSYYRIEQLSPDHYDRYRAVLLKHGRGNCRHLWSFTDLSDEEKAAAIRDTELMDPSQWYLPLPLKIRNHTLSLEHIKASQKSLDEQIAFVHRFLDEKIELELPEEQEECLWLLPALLEGNPEAKRLARRLRYRRRRLKGGSLKEREIPKRPLFDCRSALHSWRGNDFLPTVVAIKDCLLRDGRKDLISSLENLLIFLCRRMELLKGEKTPYTGLVSREIVGYFPQEWQKMIGRWAQRANKEVNSEGVRA